MYFIFGASAWRCAACIERWFQWTIERGVYGTTCLLTKPGNNFLWFQRAKTTEFLKLLLKAFFTNVHQFNFSLLANPPLLFLINLAEARKYFLPSYEVSQELERGNGRWYYNGHSHVGDAMFTYIRHTLLRGHIIDTLLNTMDSTFELLTKESRLSSLLETDCHGIATVEAIIEKSWPRGRLKRAVHKIFLVMQQLRSRGTAAFFSWLDNKTIFAFWFDAGIWQLLCC